YSYALTSLFSSAFNLICKSASKIMFCFIRFPKNIGVGILITKLINGEYTTVGINMITVTTKNCCTICLNRIFPLKKRNVIICKYNPTAIVTNGLNNDTISPQISKSANVVVWSTAVIELYKNPEL